MTDTRNDIDDIRYQHHLDHRGSANQHIFWVVWSCVGIFVLVRFGRTLYLCWERRIHRAHRLTQLSHINRPLFKRTWEFIRAVVVTPVPRIFRYNLTNLSSGALIGLAAYVIVVVALLFAVDAPTSTPHFVDDIAFRAAWVTIIQVPAAFFLSTKRGPVNVLARISYNRLAWVHRWIGRMIFVSATTHVAIMKSSISMADVLLSPDKSATVVRFGVGSYALLTWIAVSSILPLRKWSYRTFHINHTFSTLSFLVVVIQHVPKHATTPILTALGFVLLDKALIITLFLKTNISVRPLKTRFARFRRAPCQAQLVAGYSVEMLEPHNLSISADAEESTTLVRLCNIPVTWRPGQHVRLYLPALGAFEMHPFTPANCASIAPPPPLPPRGSQDVERRGSLPSTSSSRNSNDVLLMVRAHSGLTKRLKEFQKEWLRLPCPNATLPPTATSLTAYVDGPYGEPPQWEDYESLILVSTSTGVSFALSVMDYLEQLCSADASKMRTQTILFIWIVRHIEPQFEATVAELLRRYSTMLRDSGVRVETELHTTCHHATSSLSTEIDQFAHLRPRLPRYGSGDRTLTIRNPDEIYDEWEEEERQWAEMEALEEMQMKELDPFTDSSEIGEGHSNDRAAAPYEGEGYSSSETSTLLDETDDRNGGCRSKSFSEVRLTSDETVALNQPRPLSSPVLSPLLPRDLKPEDKTCQCVLIQYQRQKLRKSSKSGFGRLSYAARPDVSRIVTSAVNNEPYYRSMVAACANRSVTRQVNKAVSEAKFAFARGQRSTTVETFSEGF